MTQQVRDLVEKYYPNFPIRHSGKIYRDTTEFMNISYGDVIFIDGLHYMVLRDEVERRFGIDDPKYWVKRCKVLETGERKIVKLVFYEKFPITFGNTKILCHRSPEKEARILDIVRGDMRFMQGFSSHDDVNNNMRVIDIIRGRSLDIEVHGIEEGHETYFMESFPVILEKFIGACEAIGFLHGHGEKHGDVRRDHIWIKSKTKEYCWIDFDYTYDFSQNPFALDLFGLGNILIFIVGKGDCTVGSMLEKGFTEDDMDRLSRDDFSIIFQHRLVNLRKIYPYIPEKLNNVMLHFSLGSNVYYDTVDEMLDDLRPCLDILGP
ncbi:MAG: serine/threonine protein kinase [Thermodesulfobacteriota bacterium]|nr:serine/threonine protein kinase [Thermodesulfobacteriota bacterium]